MLYWSKVLLHFFCFFLLKVLVCLVIMGGSVSLYARDHGSSYPFLSLDTFRAFADHIVDETGTVNPKEVKYGDIIFIKTDYISLFFQYLFPSIQNPVVIITGNSDYSVPGPFAQFLDHEKLLAWFGVNCVGCKHPKMHPLPIGFANSSWGHGDISLISQMEKQKKDIPKLFLLYMNFCTQTYPKERNFVFNLFRDRSYCIVRQQLSDSMYLRDLACSKFVLSPRGNGLDCHRTWEALMLGAIPIVVSSDLDPLFEDLPVLIIHNWSEITRGFLEEKWNEMNNKEYLWEKLYVDYWLNILFWHKKNKMKICNETPSLCSSRGD